MLLKIVPNIRNDRIREPHKSYKTSKVTVEEVEFPVIE